MDQEWNVLVNEACKVRDQRTEENEENSSFQLDEDLGNGIQLILSLLNSDISSLQNSKDFNKSEFDSKRIDFIKSMWEPKEYDLPYLFDLR